MREKKIAHTYKVKIHTRLIYTREKKLYSLDTFPHRGLCLYIRSLFVHNIAAGDQKKVSVYVKGRIKNIYICSQSYPYRKWNAPHFSSFKKLM